jgi:hypothetical protein
VKRADTLRVFYLAFLILVALVAGQSGIPVEDGGEIVTIARLGGVCHPPGMPLLALLARCSWVLFSSGGPRILFALLAGTALWLLSRKHGLPGVILAAGMLLLPAFMERLLLWDAYSLLFLLFVIGMSTKRLSSAGAGFLTGIAVTIHPLGLLLPLVNTTGKLSIIRAAGGFVLGASLYLALPIGSGGGMVVDWGATGSVGSFLRQVSAAGYREVYGASMGIPTLGALARFVSIVWRILWPVLFIPAAAGASYLFRYRKSILIRIVLLFSAELVFVVLLNPMAAGTSQTGVLTLFGLSVLAFYGLRLLAGVRYVSLCVVVAVLLTGLLSTSPLTDQREEVENLFAPAPLDAGFFLSDNDLLYGAWVLKYAEDQRPDIVLLSTGNFSGWFEEMAVHFNPDLDLSRGVEDVGGLELGREELTRRLIHAAIEDNPDRQFFSDQANFVVQRARGSCI